jgi:putative hydrolase of HD superfamily
MQEIKKLKTLFLLKEVDRSFCTVKNREESTAEHTYSTLMLAQYFLPKVNKTLKKKLNELNIMKMLLYHDIVEIEAGDTYLYNEKLQIGKENKERKALLKMKSKLPIEIYKDFDVLWNAFELGKTKEARFCKAIDKLDPMIHNLDNKQEWLKAKISEKLVRDKKQKYFEEFPILLKAFNDIIKYVKENKYFYSGK